MNTKLLKIKRALVLYKTSAYKHCLNKKQSFETIAINSDHLTRFKETHFQHYKTLAEIENFLRSKGIVYSKLRRGNKSDFSKFDFIISVGGDGTLLEAARGATNQILFAINSDPKWSVGRLCNATSENFADKFESILKKESNFIELNRLRIKIKSTKKEIPVLNDILISHKNPAAMSRYYVSIDKYTEEQKSSGIWIATATGSTGAIHSAGGKILPLTSEKFQYKPREIYYVNNLKIKLKGGILGHQQKLKIISLMKDGVIYLDGSHKKFAFPLGEQITIEKSKNKLKLAK